MLAPLLDRSVDDLACSMMLAGWIHDQYRPAELTPGDVPLLPRVGPTSRGPRAWGSSRRMRRPGRPFNGLDVMKFDRFQRTGA